MTRIARVIVGLRLLILPAWIILAILASEGLPSVFNSDSAELGSLLPRSSEAVEVEKKAIETFGLPLLSHTIVVASQSRGFSASQGAAATRYIASIDKQPEGRGSFRALPISDSPACSRRGGWGRRSSSTSI
ncbi:MAG TPA: hypothetical protein VGC63_02625 [Solirubrobacterales bacterium]|jgi:hypothetical protein